VRKTVRTLGAIAACLLTAGAARAAPPPQTLREQRTVAALAARGLPVFCAGGRRREVALTFDDGPAAYTRELVAELRREGVKATFFEIGAQASGDPAATRLEGGVGVVGEHTETHATLTQETAQAAAWEITTGQHSVERALGRPVTLFRPPGDHRNSKIDRLVARQGLLSVGYTVDPHDWALHSTLAVIDAVESDPRLVPGAIVLLHENHTTTVDAVPAIVGYLRARGLTPVTVPKLLADSPPTLRDQQDDLQAGSCVHLFTP